jgi:hypothetical protein
MRPFVLQGQHPTTHEPNTVIVDLDAVVGIDLTRVDETSRHMILLVDIATDTGFNLCYPDPDHALRVCAQLTSSWTGGQLGRDAVLQMLEAHHGRGGATS